MSQQIASAAKYYLQSQGMAGTVKQIEKLVKQMPAEAIVRMATQRGFTA